MKELTVLGLSSGETRARIIFGGICMRGHESSHVWPYRHKCDMWGHVGRRDHATRGVRLFARAWVEEKRAKWAD